MTYKWWKPLLCILNLRFVLPQTLIFIISQSVVDPCQFLNPRNCPPQAPKMYVYAYIVHFWTHQRRRRASDNNWGGASDNSNNWEGGGPGNCYRRLDLAMKKQPLCVCVYIYIYTYIHIYAYVKGPTVFKEYYKKPEITKKDRARAESPHPEI